MVKRKKYNLLIVAILILFGGVLFYASHSSVGKTQTSTDSNDKISDINISVDSPDGRYRAQTTGEEELGGRTYPSTMQVTDIQTGQTLWEEHAYLDTVFLWSPDSKYLAIGYSGRTWSECKIIDTASWQELPNTDISSIRELADDLPEIYENGIAKVVPAEWLSEAAILLEIYWDTPDGQALTGSVQYHARTQEYEQLKWELISVG